MADRKPGLKGGKRMVRQILAHHFAPARSKGGARKPPEKIERLGGGITNHVFAVEHESGQVVVRIGADAHKISSFMKEQWAIEKAGALGVPTPEVLQVGTEGAGVPYMISRLVKGVEATYHPERLSILKEMGRYAALINTIPTAGFGATFDWSHNHLSHNPTWADFLQQELKMELGLETFGRTHVLSTGRIKRLRDVLEKAGRRHSAPALNHGDLRLKNLLVDEKGKISCVLDWEQCTSNLAPEWELSIALHDLSIDEKDALLDGYGLKGRQIAAIAPVMKAINLINYAPAVGQAEKSRNAGKLERLRVRLNGELDLYSL